MKKLYSYFRSLSLLLLCSATVAQCMETQEDKPITFAQIYHRLAESLHPDVMPLIFSFHLDSSGIDYANLPALIKESCTGPEAFVKSIDLLLKPENHTLVAEIFERAFAHEKISICDIKNARNDWNNWNVLHEAVSRQYLEVIKFILNNAGDKTWTLLTAKTNFGQIPLHCASNGKDTEIIKLLLKAAGDKTWTLLTTKSQYDCTALHYAANNNSTEIVELLLNTAGDNAQEFMDIQDNRGRTALDIAKPQAKDVIEKYRKNIQ